MPGIELATSWLEVRKLTALTMKDNKENYKQKYMEVKRRKEWWKNQQINEWKMKELVNTWMREVIKVKINLTKLKWDRENRNKTKIQMVLKKWEINSQEIK